ncbi:GLPGLI family protein [Chitinophaga sp.]|uniref:GLPGLI family protein n=1 Tax=Chitinophaga sp. TaxID=1869181 RepID=UPI0031DF4FA0
MKRGLMLATISLSAILGAQAQSTDTAHVMVHYKFTHVRDTTNRQHPYTENMVLLVGSSASVYKSYDRQLQDALFKKQLADQKASSPDGSIKINRQSNASGTEYYQFPNEGKLFTRERLFNSYLIESSMPAMDWKITSDTATFSGLKCQKAMAGYKGRTYTAWFCPDLPIHAGPWKLNGLPGVIVEAYDAKREVSFMFDGVEMVTPAPTVVKTASEPAIVLFGMDDVDANPDIIELPKNAIKTTESEFGKLKEAVRKNPEAFAQSMMAAQAANMPGNGPKPELKIKVAPAPVINNPIELPENK